MGFMFCDLHVSLSNNFSSGNINSSILSRIPLILSPFLNFDYFVSYLSPLWPILLSSKCYFRVLIIL